LFNSGTGNLTMTGCTVSGNDTDGGDVGGGVFNGGTASLTGCTVSDNYGYNGGGLFNSGTGNLTLTGCTVSGNSAGSSGGGLANVGTANVTLTGCTVSGNSASIGGGVYNIASANLTACTISGNSANSFGGLANQSDAYGYTGAAFLTDTIVAGNTSGASASDIGGLSDVSGSDNLVGTGGSGGLASGVDGNIVLTSLTDLGLAPLGNFGGQTQTFALLPGSPALGAGAVADDPGTTTPITTDQRGEPLDVPNPDIGAFQSQGFTLTPATGSTDQSTAISTAFANPLVVNVAANNEVEPVAGGVLTFAAPAAGPSATLSATTVTIDSSGVASVTATANSSAGSYTVTALAGGGNATAEFALTNTTGSSSGGSLTTFTVNSLEDALSGSGDSGDLRYCINEANADNGPNQIVFDPTMFGTPQTITLSLGQLELSDTGGTQTISGPTAGVTISGGENSRVFEVDAGVMASISGLTISGGAIGYPSSGAGLANYGTATLTGCTLSGNAAYVDVDGAAGVFNSGTANLTMADCIVSGNHGTGTGGLANDGAANLTDCTLSGNFGSGLLNDGTVNLTGCTVSGNSTMYGGGGVSNSGTANLTDCTVSGNSAEVGAGLNNYGTAKLTGCTVSGNSATLEGGGLASYGSGPANLIDTIVAGNTETSGASDIGGSDVSGSDNLIGTGGSGGLVSGVDGNIVLTSLTDLGLAPLGKNGGPTQTMALLPGSPAIAAGVIADDPGTTTPITTDQRGEPLDSPDPDIGAYQTQGSTLTTLSFSGISDQSITYGTSSVTISGTLADGSQAPVGETVAVTLDGVEQSPTIGSGGTFSTTFDTTGLTVADSPYTITYAYTTDGTFASASTTSTQTVNPATLTITANPETKVYGTADPALAYAVSGFQFSDTAATVVTGSPARAAGETVAGGPYAITQGTLAADGNYMIQFSGSTLTITPATPPVTVTALGGTYTGAPIAAAATVPGLGGTATPDLEGVTPTLTYYAGSSTAGTNLGSMPPSAAGTYTVVARFPASADYAANQSKAATFTISPARATIVLEPHAVLKRKKTLKRVELTAAIQPVAPGGGMPTGQVTFEFLKKHGKKLKVTTLGTVELHGGEATLTFKPIQVLNKPLTIVYSGDPDFLASMLSPPKLTKKTLV
jgi:MBG domain (YGX type)